MRLSQIISEADDHVNYDGLDQSIINKLSKYKSHQQQWAVRELRNGGDINSVIDALDYYITKISDNRFKNILKSRSPSPKNILSLSLGDIKAAQHDFEVRYSGLSKRERDRLKSNVIVDDQDFKVIKFEKNNIGDMDTAKALATAAQFTNWCVVNTYYGNKYLDMGPIYLIVIHAKAAELEVVVPRGKPIATNQYLCHAASSQMMDVKDKPVKMPESICLRLSEYIDDIGIFCSDKRTDIYKNSIIQYPKLAIEYARDVISGRWPEAEPTIMKDPWCAYVYASDIIKGRWPEAEPTIMQNQDHAYWYARDVIKGRWPEAEPTIIQDLDIAYNYAKFIIKGRWPELEPLIVRDATRAHEYARWIIGDRWPEAEQYIIQNTDSAYKYARNIIRGRWPEAEPYIMQNPNCAYQYARDVIKGRWPEAEPTIIKHPYWALEYTIEVIGDRWPEAEPTIIQNPEMACEYARHVINGRWPEAERTITKNYEAWKDYTKYVLNHNQTPGEILPRRSNSASLPNYLD